VHTRTTAAFSLLGVLILGAPGASAQITRAPAPAPTIAPPPPTVAPAPKPAPRIEKAPPCPTEPIKVTKLIVDPNPLVRCKVSSVTVTITAQACGAPAGGSYRVRVGDVTFAWGDVPPLAAGASTEVKTTYAPGPMDSSPTLIAEVGPPVVRSTNGPPPSGGFGAGFGVVVGAATAGLAALGGGQALGVPSKIPDSLIDGSQNMKNAGLELFKQADAVKATKTPTWVEDAKVAYATKLQMLGTKSVAFGDRMLTICPRDAGIETNAWISQMKKQIAQGGEAAELKDAVAKATAAADALLGAAFVQQLTMSTPWPLAFGGFSGGIR
jgi:hypothetical protein